MGWLPCWFQGAWCRTHRRVEKTDRSCAVRRNWLRFWHPCEYHEGACWVHYPSRPTCWGRWRRKLLGRTRRPPCTRCGAPSTVATRTPAYAMCTACTAEFHDEGDGPIPHEARISL